MTDQHIERCIAMLKRNRYALSDGVVAAYMAPTSIGTYRDDMLDQDIEEAEERADAIDAWIDTFNAELERRRA
jgi:hypothetical protein